MVRQLRPRPDGYSELFDCGVATGIMYKTYKKPVTPVKVKRPKVESVIRITRSRETRVLGKSPTPPPSPAAKEEVPTLQAEVKTQRVVRAQYKDRILTITGIPLDKRIKDDEPINEEIATVNPPAKRKVEDEQRTPRKRKRVDWAAKNAGSPRRSRRNAQPATASFEQDEEDHGDPVEANDQMSPQEDNDQTPPQEDQPIPSTPLEIQPQQTETPSPSTKQIDFAFTVPGVVADPFKSPATDVTDCYFDAVAEQSVRRSPTLSRKVVSEPSEEQVLESTAAASPVENGIETPDQSPIKDINHDTHASSDSDQGYAPRQSPQDRRSSSRSSLSSQITTTSPPPPYDDSQAPDDSPPIAIELQQTSSHTTSNTLNLVPFLPMPKSLPPRSAFADKEAYTLASKFRPLMPIQNFLTALTSQALCEQSTADLFELARCTQHALQAWQDEYITLDKKTAPVAGPFPKKPATGGRLPLDPMRWEVEKEKELFGEGSLLSGLVKRRGRTAGTAKTVTDPPTTHEGRELRKRRGEASFIEGLGISEDDAGALTEGKRSRRPVRRFEVGQNGEGKRGVRRRRGAGGGLLGTAISGESHADASARNGYDSDAIQGGLDSDVPVAASSTPVPRKRGRLSALQNSFSNSNSHDTNNDSNDTSPSPTPDPADGDFSDTHAPIRRRTATTNNSTATTNNSTATTTLPRQALYSAAGSPAGGTATSTAGTGEQQPRKQRKKSEKRSESMTAWWAERKRKAAAEKAAAVAAGSAGGGGASSGLAASRSGLGRTVASNAEQIPQEGKEKRAGGVARKEVATNGGITATISFENTELHHDKPTENEKTNATHREPHTRRSKGKEKIFGPAGLDARGGVMEAWAVEEPRWDGVGVGVAGGERRVSASASSNVAAAASAGGRGSANGQAGMGRSRGRGVDW